MTVQSAEAALKASEAQAVAARDLLENAIESLSEGFVYFDAQERLVLCNRRYKEIFSGIADILEPGVSLEAVAGAMLARGLFAGSKAEQAVFGARRMADFRDGKSMELQLAATICWRMAASSVSALT